MARRHYVPSKGKLMPSGGRRRGQRRGRRHMEPAGRGRSRRELGRFDKPYTTLRQRLTNDLLRGRFAAEAARNVMLDHTPGDPGQEVHEELQDEDAARALQDMLAERGIRSDAGEEEGVWFVRWTEPRHPVNSIKVGDYVRVRGNAAGTMWEHGKVMELRDGYALIGYGGRDLPDYNRAYGLNIREPTYELEKVD